MENGKFAPPEAQEFRSNGKDTTPSINLKETVASFLTGDEAAYEDLDKYMDSFLKNGFYSMGAQAEDLLQEAKIKIWSNLATFDPNIGRGSFTIKFRAWATRVALNIRRDAARKSKKQLTELELHEGMDFEDESNPQTQQSSPEEIEERNRAFSEIMRKKINELISSSSQRKIVDLALSGLKPVEIAAGLGLEESNVKAQLSKARDKIEKDLIFPTGLKRLSKFVTSNMDRNALYDAVRSGKISYVRFLNLYYCTPEEYQRFKSAHKPTFVSESSRAQGLVPIADVAKSHTEYIALKTSNFVVRENGRILIHSDQLAEFRSKWKPIKNRILGHVSEGNIPLAELGVSYKEYLRMTYAARKGKFQVEKAGHRLLAKPEDIEKFRELNKDSSA